MNNLTADLTSSMTLGFSSILTIVVSMILAVVLIGLLMTLLVNIQAKGNNSYLLVIRMTEEAERTVAQAVASIRIHKLKSKNISASGVEMTYEVRLDKPEAVLSKIHTIRGVQDATLVSYQGEAA